MTSNTHIVYPTVNGRESSSRTDNSYAALFYNTVQDTYMTQHVKLPTRRRCKQTPSVLDLIFTADPNMISNLLHLPPLGYSDHEVLIWSYICYSGPPVMSQDY